MLVIEPTKGRWLIHWVQMHWTRVETNVRRLQARIYREGLEPCEGRLSCTVLRGLGYGNIPWLPGASGSS